MKIHSPINDSPEYGTLFDPVKFCTDYINIGQMIFSRSHGWKKTLSSLFLSRRLDKARLHFSNHGFDLQIKKSKPLLFLFPDWIDLKNQNNLNCKPKVYRYPYNPNQSHQKK